MSDLNKTSGQQGSEQQVTSSSTSQPPIGAYQTDLRMRQLRDAIQCCSLKAEKRKVSCFLHGNFEALKTHKLAE